MGFRRQDKHVGSSGAELYPARTLVGQPISYHGYASLTFKGSVPGADGIGSVPTVGNSTDLMFQKKVLSEGENLRASRRTANVTSNMTFKSMSE